MMIIQGVSIETLLPRDHGDEETLHCEEPSGWAAEQISTGFAELLTLCFCHLPLCPEILN